MYERRCNHVRRVAIFRRFFLTRAGSTIATAMFCWRWHCEKHLSILWFKCAYTKPDGVASAWVFRCHDQPCVLGFIATSTPDKGSHAGLKPAAPAQRLEHCGQGTRQQTCGSVNRLPGLLCIYTVSRSAMLGVLHGRAFLCEHFLVPPQVTMSNLYPVLRVPCTCAGRWRGLTSTWVLGSLI
jgi:hypothetical protein